MKIKTSEGKQLETTSVWLDNDDTSKLYFVDQRYIPFKVEILISTNPKMTAEFIQKMVVRGAPAIGGTAAYGIVQSVTIHNSIDDRELKKKRILDDAEEIATSRPTAVDLRNVVHQMVKVVERTIYKEKEIFKSEIIIAAEQIVDTIIQECRLLAETGQTLVHDGMNIIHHCNTGPLATLDVGSALGVIIESHKKGKKIHVYVDETRPRLQGGRLTTWELTQEKVPHTLIVDTVSALLMKEKKILQLKIC